jgi:hypothetical protein
MGSTQANPDERDLRYLKLIVGRHEGRPEKEIAASMGYDSPVDLYRQIKRDGHPICPTCGTTYPVEGHCEQPKGEYKLQAWKAGGETTELPLASKAIGLFQAALDIHQKNILDLERRREYFKDGRFIVECVYSGDAGESWKTHHRGDMSDTAWEAYCRKHGKDPDLDSFDVPADYVAPGGVSQAPPEPLTKLIAMYILSGLLIETMLAALHPEPKNVDMEQLKLHIHGKKIERGIRPGLEGEARRIARLVRGGTLNRQGGRTTGGLSPMEEEAARYIQLKRQNGVPDEKILQELQEGHGFTQSVLRDYAQDIVLPLHFWPDMTMGDLRRLGSLKLNPNPRDA